MAKKLPTEAIVGLSLVGVAIVIFAVIEFIIPKQPAPGGGAGMPSPTKGATPQPQPPPPFTKPQATANSSNSGVPYLPDTGSGNPWDNNNSTFITAPDGTIISVPVFTPASADQSNVPVLDISNLPESFETIDQQYIDVQNGKRRR